MCSRPSSRCRSSLNRVLGSYLFAIGRTTCHKIGDARKGLEEMGKLCPRVVMQYGIYKWGHLPNVSMQRIWESYLCYHAKGSI